MGEPKAGTQNKQAIDRRYRLDGEAIVSAVLKLALEERQERFTFKRLGEELGVDATAMYRHFRNRDAILRAALDRLYAMALEQSDPGDEAKAWRSRLERSLTTLVEVFVTYPSIGCEAFTTDTHGRGELGHVEYILACLRDAGLSGDRLVQNFAALSSYAVGIASGMARDVLSKSDPRGNEQWLGSMVGVPYDTFPLLEENRQALLRLDSFTIFSAGLSAILDSIERDGAQILP